MIYQIWEPNREMQKQIQISCFKQSDSMCIPRHHQVLQNPNQQENCSKIKHLIVSAGSFPNSCLQDIICNVSPRFCYNHPYSVLKSISTLFRKLCQLFFLAISFFVENMPHCFPSSKQYIKHKGNVCRTTDSLEIKEITYHIDQSIYV